MSPEYTKICELAPQMRSKLKGILGKDAYRHMVHTGFGYNPSEFPDRVFTYSELGEDVLIKCRKSSSLWHVVKPLDGSSKDAAEFRSTFEGELLNHHGKKHRGKHRSHTKGTGFDAIRSQSRVECERRIR